MSDPFLFHMHRPTDGGDAWFPVIQCRICGGLVREKGLVLWDRGAGAEMTDFTVVCGSDCAQIVHERATSITEWGDLPIGRWFAAAAGMTGVGAEVIEHIENAE